MSQGKKKQRPGFQPGKDFYRNSRGYKYGSRPSPANFMMVGGPPAGFDSYLGMTKQSLNRGSKSNLNDLNREMLDEAIKNYKVR